MSRIAAIAFIITLSCGSAFAEFRSAKDMQKEYRVALDVLHQRADKSFENVLFTGECIGYIQAGTDAAQSFAENVSWYKVCLPANLSTELLIQKFIAFVDKNPKYELVLQQSSLCSRMNFRVQLVERRDDCRDPPHYPFSALTSAFRIATLAPTRRIPHK